MNLPSRPQTKVSEKTWKVSVPLRPGACTIVDWAQCVVTDEGASSKGDDDEQHDAQSDTDDSSSEGSDSEDAGGGGYASGTMALPPAIASDPFFARLLRNAEIHEANEKKTAKRRAPKRSASDMADDDYDFNDPFIDDSELTFMNGHSHTNTNQRKKRRKKDDSNATEPEGQGAVGGDVLATTAVTIDEGGLQPVTATIDSATSLDAPSLEDVDRYEEDDFFVYFGPLNESADNTDEDTFEEPAVKTTRGRKRTEKKQQPSAKESGPSKKRVSGAAAGPKGGNTSDAPLARKRPEAKAQHRRNGSDTAINTALIPSNGRKSGPRTSRKLDQTKSNGNLDGTVESTKQRRPPVPERDKFTGALAKASSVGAIHSAQAGTGVSLTDDSAPLISTLLSGTLGRGAESDGWAAARRGGTPTAGGGNTPLADQAAEANRAESEARLPTPEIDAAMSELAQAAEVEQFTNRQRFPSTLKPPLRMVCELCMVRALEYDRQLLSLDTPEHSVFSWSTPLDIVGFTTGIYTQLADILPYNRATVRKIVSKLLGADLITWKERQLKQIECGLKARIDEQIESGMGWIPVAPRAASKEGADDGTGSQVRWHWTTLSKHILFQYMLLTLNVKELRSHLGQTEGKDGAYREQQVRKDAYAHLANLWPGSSMSTYEISRAYSSRKSLLEKQSRKSDGGAGLPAKKESGAGTDVAESDLQAAHPSVVVTEHSEHVPPPFVQQQQQQQVLSTPPQTRGEHAHLDSLSPVSAGNRRHEDQAFGHPRLPSPSQMLEDRPAPKFAASPLSHRSLHFGQAGAQPPHGLGVTGQAMTTLDQQVRSRTSALFGSATPPRQHKEAPQSHQSPPPGNSGDAGYSSPGSSRYSMSVHNLTSP